MNLLFRNIVYLSDVSGTGKWRRIFPMLSIDCIALSANISNTYSQNPVIDLNYYRGMTSVTIQRWLSDSHKDIVMKFLKPVCDMNQGWLIYEIDDNMSDKCIPKFNRGRAAFEGEKILGNLRTMLNAADLVTVTTDYIKNFYHDNYGVPLDNILAVPNLLPKWWFGDKYDPDKKAELFKKNKAKPRIGFVSSLSHFNVDGVMQDGNGLATRRSQDKDGKTIWKNEKGEIVPEDQLKKIEDDFDLVADLVRQTVNDFTWVFFGYCPPQVKDLAESKKIEVHGGQPIMNYASYFSNLDLQAVVAEIQDIEFNRCKSHIKTMECAVLGVPLFASNALPYNRVMPQDQLFSTADELKQKLLKLKFGSVKIYRDIIERQWKWFNTPCHEGDFDIKNYWLEDNLNIWIDLFRLKSKTITVPMNAFVTLYEARLEQEKKNTIKVSESGEAKITL